MKSNKMHLFLITTLMATVSYAITPVHYVEPSLVRYYEYSINLINTHCPSNKIFYPPKTKVNFAKAEVGRYGEKIWVGLCEQTLHLVKLDSCIRLALDNSFDFFYLFIVFTTFMI